MSCSAGASAPTSTSTCTWPSARRCRCTRTSSSRTSRTVRTCRAEAWTNDSREPVRRPSCCSGRSCRWTGTSTSSRSTSTPRPPILDADKYEIGSNRGAKEMNRGRPASVDLDGRDHPPRPDRVPHRAARHLGRAALVRHLLQRLPGELLAALDRGHRRDPDPADAGPRRHGDPSTSRWPTAVRSGWTPPPPTRRAPAPSSSTCRSSRSSTAAGTGTTSSPVTRTSSSSRRSGPPRSPRTGPSTAPSTSPSPR